MRDGEAEGGLGWEVLDNPTNEMTVPPGLIARLCKMRWDMEKNDALTNTSEIKRKAKGRELETAHLAEKGTMPVLLRGCQRLIQRFVKHIRWLRAYLFHEASLHGVAAAINQTADSF